VNLTKEQKEFVSKTNLNENEVKAIKRAFMEVKGIPVNDNPKKRSLINPLSSQKKSQSASTLTEEEEELNIDEFKKVFSSFTSVRPDDSSSDVDFDQIFAAVDADHNGKVSFREMILWLSIYAKGTEEEKLKHLFRFVDEDGNGVVEGAEINTLLDILKISAQEQKMAESGAIEKARALLKAMDVDKDNQVTLEEWISIGKKVGLVKELLGPQFVAMMQGLKITG